MVCPQEWKTADELSGIGSRQMKNHETRGAKEDNSGDQTPPLGPILLESLCPEVSSSKLFLPFISSSLTFVLTLLLHLFLQKTRWLVTGLTGCCYQGNSHKGKQREV